MSQKLPQHIAIVMDGNGRWAEQRGLERVEGHLVGVGVVKTITEICLDKKIPVLSLFAFSSENWTRPSEEVNFLMKLFIDSVASEIKKLHDRNIRLQFIGDRDQLSTLLQQEMEAAERLTAQNKQLTLNVMLNYGGKWDILQAACQLAVKVKAGDIDIDKIDVTLFESLLSTKNLPEPDLFVRTSGEQRISNFFLWQLAYTELYFTEVYWPDFSEHEFNKALAYFSRRKRRYGGATQQLKASSYV